MFVDGEYIGRVGVAVDLFIDKRCSVLNLKAPSVANAFDIESFAQNPDLTPGIPVRRNEDFVTVNDIMFEILTLKE